MSQFVRVFPRVALAVFGLMLPIVLGAGIVVFLADSASTIRRTDSPLPTWVVDHPRVLAVSCVAFAAFAVAASIGMIRKRQWAHTLWTILIPAALLWTMLCLVSALTTLLSGPGRSAGHLPSFEVLAAMGVVPPAAALLALGIYLLRRLLSQEVRAEFGKSRSQETPVSGPR